MDRQKVARHILVVTLALDEQLDVLSADGVATVVQDDLQNTYQRVDEGVEG